MQAAIAAADALAPPAIEARGLIKNFGDKRAVDGIDLSVPAGSIFGVLGPNGAGKTTTLRMLLGIIDPDTGSRTLLGETRPLRAATRVGYLPEERGLYPAMHAVDAIAFMGALRGMKLKPARARALELLEAHGLGDAARKPIRTLSKGMAQTVQLIGTIIHRPRLIVLDEPFSGLDALNQQRLEAMIRAQAADGVTVLFSTHVIAHAERLCERIAIIAGGRVRFSGTVDEARARLPQQVRLETRATDGPWRATLPADAERIDGVWRFAAPPAGIEPLLTALIAGGAGIETLAIERPGLHDAFVSIAGDAAAEALDRPVADEVMA
ncbi:ATP-binding cassette domain-containing protein [Sphingomonas sp. 1P06PA]|uniref:ABC transporter ATP-binding protein n=1 Tax=Sphingomonas sp. 1P06PA TaxID=554121 RepID=UPI0039A5A594